MENQNRQPWENSHAWLRLLIMIVLGFFYWFCHFIVFIVAIVQLGFVLITGERSEPLQHFAARLAIYIKQLVDFLVFNHETRPFPFSDFPSFDEMSSAAPAARRSRSPSTAKDDVAGSGGVTATASRAASTTAKKKTSGKKRSRKRTDTSSPGDKETNA